MPVFHYRNGNRLFLRDIFFFLFIQDNACNAAVRKIGLIAFFGKVGIGIHYFRQRHIQPVQHLLVSHIGHNIMRLGVIFGDNTVVNGIIHIIAKQYIHIPSVQIYIQFPVHKLFAGVIFQIAVNIVAFQIYLQTPDILIRTLIYAYCLSFNTFQVIGLNAHIVPARQKH